MPRLTPEQAAACDAWSKDGTEENWVQLARVRAGIYGFDSELLAERILDLLDLLQQAEADRKVLAAEVLASRQRCTARKQRSVMEPGARCGYGHPADPMMAGQKCPVCAAMEATDASGALTRGGGA